ncbi:S1-like domain-containing RNA-binding protein [Limibacter armeniacum]|uniref:CvfB family protein n=1 Tax=Limibacter armeniacum TaxID=466084 RepID=UPI002FE5DA82
MIKIADYNKLKVERKTDIGYYLLGDDEEILMPNNCILDESFKEGDTIKVFVYKDHKNRLVATQEEPLAKDGDFACLEVVDVNDSGAFMDWGLTKQLMVPYAEQSKKMNIGEKHVVRVLVDPRTDRQMGTAKLGSFFMRAFLELKENEEVDLLVIKKTDIGYSCVVNNLLKGLLYSNEVFQKLYTGDRLKGYVKKVREDGLIDLSAKKPGYNEDEISKDAQMLLGKIMVNGGRLAITDKSSPEIIKEELSMSKKHFKKVVGFLLKNNLIEIFSDEIVLKQ